MAQSSPSRASAADPSRCCLPRSPRRPSCQHQPWHLDPCLPASNLAPRPRNSRPRRRKRRRDQPAVSCTIGDVQRNHEGNGCSSPGGAVLGEPNAVGRAIEPKARLTGTTRNNPIPIDHGKRMPPPRTAPDCLGHTTRSESIGRGIKI